jgi:hypothetical protein
MNDRCDGQSKITDGEVKAKATERKLCSDQFVGGAIV